MHMKITKPGFVICILLIAGGSLFFEPVKRGNRYLVPCGLFQWRVLYALEFVTQPYNGSPEDESQG